VGSRARTRTRAASPAVLHTASVKDSGGGDYRKSPARKRTPAQDSSCATVWNDEGEKTVGQPVTIVPVPVGVDGCAYPFKKQTLKFSGKSCAYSRKIEFGITRFLLA
jgi:hypothetical protein